MTINFIQRNEYFATYHCFNEKSEKIGIIEDHDRGVKHQYFVAWIKPNLTNDDWETTTFDTREAAIQHIEENAKLKEEKKMIKVEGRRWFNKTFGNTYHSVRIYKDGELIHEQPYAYGYEDQYRQTAADLLGMTYGEFNKSANAGEIEVTVTDVKRKKDL